MMPAETADTPGSDYVDRPGLVERYTAEEHAIWRTLFDRQAAILPERAAPEYPRGACTASGIAAEGIPDFGGSTTC